MKTMLINLGVAADEIFPLFGDLDPQAKDALTPRPYPRIILATSLAALAMTIPDVDVVLDSGVGRFTSDDEVPSSFDYLISAMSVKQREGRAGRAKAGCYVRFLCKELFSVHGGAWSFIVKVRWGPRRPPKALRNLVGTLRALCQFLIGFEPGAMEK